MEPNRSQNFFIRYGIAKTEQTANLIAIIVIAACLWVSYTILFGGSKQITRPPFGTDQKITTPQGQPPRLENSPVIPQAPSKEL